MISPGNPQPAPTVGLIGEVRYSLPQMLAELQLERSNGSFAMEKLDQKEIGKLFKAKAPRRAKAER